MFNPFSIRTRIRLWFVTAVFLIVLILGLSFYFYMQNFLYANAKRLIRDKNFAVGGWIDYRIKDMSGQVNGYKSSQEANIYIQVTDLKRNVLGKTDNLKEHLPLSDSLARIVYKLDDVVLTTYQSRIYGTMLVANGTGLTDGKILGFVQVAIPEHEITKTLDTIEQWFLIALPILLLLSVFAGSFLTKRLIKPFDVIRQSADKIDVGELASHRLPVINPNDELGKLTTTVNNLLERLFESIKSQQQFVADAAHELRTPLSIMQSEIELALRQETLSHDLRELLLSNLEEVQRLGLITGQLITLTRFEAQRSTLEKSEVNFSALIFEVLEKFSSTLQNKMINCNIHVPEKVFLVGHKGLLEQMLINLIDNAIKYSNNNTNISITLEKISSGVVFHIKDEGFGIPDSELSNIFHRFYRVDKSRSSQIPGSGLGLAIVQSIIDFHGGKIEVKSEMGMGSEFIITF